VTPGNPTQFQHDHEEISATRLYQQSLSNCDNPDSCKPPQASNHQEKPLQLQSTGNPALTAITPNPANRHRHPTIWKSHDSSSLPGALPNAFKAHLIASPPKTIIA
jgi:hypothetical protein